MGVRMRSGVVTGLLPVFALGSLFSATALKADDAAPTNGVPEESIAKDWNDPMRASLAKQGVLYGLG
jgi:porin